MTAMTATPSTRPAPPRPSPAASGMRLASIGLRCSAFLLDYILTMLIPAVSVLLAVSVKRRWGLPGVANTILIIGYLATAALVIFNSVYLCERDGQSFGKRFIGIRIVRIDGSRPSFRTAIVRHLIGMPLSLLCGGLGLWWALWDGRQQGWHDKLAGTLVMKESGD